jgi:hypothetical protein
MAQVPSNQIPGNTYPSAEAAIAGQKKSGGFLKGLAGAIPDLTRIAGGIGDIYSIATRGQREQQSINQIQDWAKQTLSDIRDVFGSIGDISGLPNEKIRPELYKEYANIVGDIWNQARADLDVDPRIDAPYERLGGRIQDTTKQYSLLRNPVYEAAYKAPDAVAPIDTDSIKNVMTLGPSFREHYSYSDPETQKLIKGGGDTLAAYAAALSSGPDVQRLMTYNI